MKIKISYPNDFGSEARYRQAVAECGESEEMMLEVLAEAAKAGGCRFVEASDYGAIWEGEALPALPEWAGVAILEGSAP